MKINGCLTNRGCIIPLVHICIRARLAMYAHVQSKQVRLLPKGHVCIYIHKFHIFHSSNSSLGFNGLIENYVLSH